MADAERPQATTKERRRRRPPISCTVCRKRKIRCNRELPCNNCTRSKTAICVYESSADLQPRGGVGVDHDTGMDKDGSSHDERLSRASAASHHTLAANYRTAFLPEPLQSSTSWSHPSSVIPSSPESQVSTWTVESMARRIKELEAQLSEIANNRPTGQLVGYQASDAAKSGSTFMTVDIQPLKRSVMSKNRLFGQSHWMNGAVLLKDTIEHFRAHSENRESECFKLLQKCKALARTIKSLRISHETAPLVTELPPREIADRLVDNYLNTTESVFRVLHIPSFKRDYELYWLGPSKPGGAFLVQLKLVMAIGSATYDDVFSLRTSATTWVRDAQNWLSLPSPKARLNVPSLQVFILLCLARQLTAIGADLVWTSAGAMLRTAMCLGLHRDPLQLPRKTHFSVEMRRRIWNTVLEICLQTSIDSGGPPLLSMSDFDTEPPSNLDDDQLVDTEIVDPSARPLDCFTQTSTAIALRMSFPTRLAIAKFLNDFSTAGSYSDTIRHDANLRAASKSISRTFQAYPPEAPSPSPFTVNAVDFIIRRYFLSLHLPFVGQSLHDTNYAFSRQVAVETALRIGCAVFPSASASADFENVGSSGAATGQSSYDAFARLALCSAGFFRSVPMQACLFIALEVCTQLKEEDSIGPIRVRPDLLVALQETKIWQLRRLKAGETSVKGHLFISALTAQIEALKSGLPQAEIGPIVIGAAEEAMRTGMSVLLETVSQLRSEKAGEGMVEPTPETILSMDSDWEIQDTLQDAEFDFGDVDSFFVSGYKFADTPDDFTSWPF